MTRQYEQESAPLLHQALIGNLLDITMDEEETSMSNDINNDTDYCMQGDLLEPEELST